MLVFLNGKFVPEEQATVSVFDRGFCLSDGLFEAIPVYRSKIFLWEKHFERFQAGAQILKIKLPFLPDAIRDFAQELLRKSQMADCVLRMQLSRGTGPRGYSIKGADLPILVMSLHPRPKISSPAQIIISSVRIPSNDPLASFKACNKLPHILARMEADERGADEALLLNTDGNIAEATSANLFWTEKKSVCTPPLRSGALPGVTRGVVLKICERLQIPRSEKDIAPESLLKCEGAFLTSIAVEIREISKVNGHDLPRSPITQMLRDAFLKYVESSHQNA